MSSSSTSVSSPSASSSTGDSVPAPPPLASPSVTVMPIAILEEENQRVGAEETAANGVSTASQPETSRNEDRTTHLDDDVDEVVLTNEEPITIFDERGRRRSGRQHALAEAHQRYPETIDITNQREMETATTRGRRHVRIIRHPRGRPRRNLRQSSEEPILVSSENESPTQIDTDRRQSRDRHSALLPSPSELDASFEIPSVASGCDSKKPNRDKR